jgi:magnesium transporter
VKTTQFDELLPLKNDIDELSKRVKEVKRAIMDILNNDVDMRMMYLSPPDGLPERTNSVLTDESDSSEPTNLILPNGSNKIEPLLDTMNLEMLFENYLNEICWIASEVEDVIDGITNTEENVALELRIQSNRIMRFELSLSMSSFVVTCGALITGLFGMNLVSHLELNPAVFYIVTALMTTGMAGIWLSFKRYAQREKLF